MQWDIFCRVIDNFGDIGVCWRLAADLASRGETVRLVVDDARALAFMAPHGAPGVVVVDWASVAGARPPSVGDVVIEAFGCDLPEAMLAAMSADAASGRANVWINLEYLSAEAEMERNHGLSSPQWVGAASGLTKWFFYPGFTPRTGGLLREPWLQAPRDAFDERIFLEGVGKRAGEWLVSVFAYDLVALPEIIAAAKAPMRLLATAGLGDAVRSQAARRTGSATVRELPWLSQREFDALLRACDLNLVRGEDSFVRAQWAGRPFVWQIYPQHDGVHRTKLDAFLERFLADASPGLARSVRSLWMLHNGFHRGAAHAPWPDIDEWTAHCERWRHVLEAQPDLTSQLIHFARGKTLKSRALRSGAPL